MVGLSTDPELLARAAQAFEARQPVPWVSISDNTEWSAHRWAREEAIRTERTYIAGDGIKTRRTCCLLLNTTRMGGGMASWHKHVSGYRHIASVFGVDEGALRRTTIKTRAFMLAGLPTTPAV